MRQLYMRGWNLLFATGDSGYVYSERVEPGWILHVHNAFCYAPERDASDNIVLGILHGGERIIVRAQSALAAQRGMESVRDFMLSEGDVVFAYFPDAEDGDTLGLHLIGELMPVADWRKGIH